MAFLNANWSLDNNYGRKRTDYEYCSTYPKDLIINNILTIRKDFYRDGIPGLWFQEGYHLENFIPIDNKLINHKLFNNE